MQPPINPPFISPPSMVAFSQDNAMETAANRDKNPNQHSQLIKSKQKFYIGLKKIKRMNVHISTGPVFCWLRMKRRAAHLTVICSEWAHSAACPRRICGKWLLYNFSVKAWRSECAHLWTSAWTLEAAKTALCFSATERTSRWEMSIWGEREHYYIIH